MNKYLKLFIFSVFCCLGYQNAIGQCTSDISATTYINYNDTFNGAPCDDGTGACPFNELTALEIWAQQGYIVDSIVAGVTYTVSACNSAAGAGMGAQTWPLEFTIYNASDGVDAFGLNFGSTCELTFTATESGTYVIGVYEAGACGTSTNTTGAASNNGYIAMTCDGTAPACPVLPPPSPCYAGDIIAGFDTLTVCPEETFTFDVLNDTLTSGGYTIGFSDTYQGNGITQTGMGGIAGGFSLTGVGSLPYVGNETLNGLIGPGSQNPGLDVLTGTWYLFGIALDEGGATCSVTSTAIAVTFLTAGDFACQGTTPACDANPDAPTSAPVCGDTDPYSINFGGACAVDSNVEQGNQGGFSIFYETDGAGAFVDAGVGGTVYTTGDEILANLNSAAAGEVTFFGAFGDCSGVDAAITFTQPDTASFTLDVYIVPVEASAGGTVLVIDGDCPIAVVTVTVNPDTPLVVSTAGSCDTDGTAVVGYDLDDDGATGAPDGDLGDAGDIVITTLTAASEDLSPFPCGGAGSSATATLTAAELEGLLGVAAGSGCYADISVTADCPAEACPPCDVTPAVLSAPNEACNDGSTGPASLSEDTAGTGGITEYVVTDADGSVTGTADVIISVGSFQEAEDAVAALGAGATVCVTAMTYDQPGLDGIVADLNTCTGGLAGLLLGLPDTGNTFEIIFEAIVAFNDPDPTGLTIATVEALIGGGGGGPGLGGEADLSALLPNLTCPVAPFCYRLSNTVCAVGGDACPIDPCEGATATACDDGDPCTTGDMETLAADGSVCVPCAGTVDTSSCDAACSTTQACDDGDPCTTGDMETVAADGSVCVPCAGTVDASSCDVACSTTQACDDGDPCTTGDMETVAADGSVCVPCAGTVDASSCDAACSTTQACDDGDPCTTGDMETLAADGSVCVPCAGTVDASSCDAACSTTQACDDGDPCTTGDMETVAADGSVCVPCAGTVDASSCGAACSTTQACDDGDANTVNDMETVAADGSICVPCAGTATNCDTDPTTTQACDDGNPCTINDMETVLNSDGSVCVPCAGTVDASSCDAACSTTQACDDGDPCTTGETETLAADGSVCVPCGGGTAVTDCNCTNTVQACDDGDPCTLNDMETVADNGDVCVPCTGEADPACDFDCPAEMANFGDTCDDGDPTTVNDVIQSDCSCAGVTVPGCTDATACNFDTAATVDDNSCVFATGCDECDGMGGVTDNPEAGDACDDGDALTINDTIQADCSCVGTSVTPVSLGLADPCNCDEGIDLDGDGTNDLAQETITIVPGMAPYSATSVSGLVDASGNALDAAGIDALINGTTIVAYVPADGASTYSLTIEDANGTSAGISGGPCTACAPTPVLGCTNPAACNFDAAANTDDGTCEVPGDSCNDGNPLTVNDALDADCICVGDPTGEPIPTVGEWGLIILALILLNLGVLYIRQTEIKIVSE